MGTTVRPLTRDDIPALATLYQDAYGPAMVASLDAAQTEMTSAFDGEWGRLWPDASLGLWRGATLVSAVQTVVRPTWNDAPDLPWIIEVFTEPQARRFGYGRALVIQACRTVRDGREKTVGLTVDESNVPAVVLYQSLGFERTAPAAR